jgi:hypothetical protein
MRTLHELESEIEIENDLMVSDGSLDPGSLEPDEQSASPIHCRESRAPRPVGRGALLRPADGTVS